MSTPSIASEEKDRIELLLGQQFTPSAPIDSKTLFAGRTDQVRRVIDAIFQRGQHAIIFGERGVGKTSLARVISEYLEGAESGIIAPHVNCTSLDTYGTLWQNVFESINLSMEKRGIGFTAQPTHEAVALSPGNPETITPGLVERALERVGELGILIVIIDEFDRAQNGPLPRVIADTIKSLSDHSVNATIVLVGVADTVDGLIEEHLSIERAMIQIQMPRMSSNEISKIILNGLNDTGMTVGKNVIRGIVKLSQGLPHYAHLLGRETARAALDDSSMEIKEAHFTNAIESAIRNAQQSLISDYHTATSSPRREAIYQQVLLACALTRHDELGFFAPADVREPLTKIMGRRCEIAAFAKHLSAFCDSTRGPILQRTGVERRYRYRFKNPLMQPFVILQGLASHQISDLGKD